MSSLGKKILSVYLPDTRNVEISAYGCGNTKLGPSVFTYSRLAGDPAKGNHSGTCPGSSPECEDICYAKRIQGVVRMIYDGNSMTDEVPPIPDECKILRIHVSGDFDTIDYIASWHRRLKERPDVRAWTYTRSWRVSSLLAALEGLRQLPNLQLFASMDSSIPEMPPAGWRRAWIDGDPRAGTPQEVHAHMDDPVTHNLVTVDGGRTYVCPEETKRQPHCEACGYCIEGKKNDVTFLRH